MPLSKQRGGDGGGPRDAVFALMHRQQLWPLHFRSIVNCHLFPLTKLPYAGLMPSKIVGVRFSQALRAALPIYCVFLITITFIIFFPKVVLWLPKQVLPESVGCFKNPTGTGYICSQ